jgi:ribosomal protein S18 acetylase RimI-like enzyme
VQEKLDDTAACLLVGTEGDGVIAMALAEPARERRGVGAIRPADGHVSMVFVDPERWGRGVGTALLEVLRREMEARRWRTASLWTRTTNERARRLYEGRGYHLTADVDRLANGDQIVRYELDLCSRAQQPSATSLSEIARTCTLNSCRTRPLDFIRRARLATTAE